MSQLSNIDTSRWMEQLEEQGLGDLSILKTVIPGSHDSSTCNISRKQPFASNAPPILKKAQSFLPFLSNSRLLKDIVVKWAIAQERTITQQLEDGIRYLDLRVCSVKEPGFEYGTLYTCHSIISDVLDDILKEIKNFTEKHSKEILIVDFQHFYDLDEADHKYLVEMIQQLFGDKLIPNTFSLTDSIQTIWDNNWSIFVFYGNRSIANKHEFLWSHSSLKSAWMDQANIKGLFRKLDSHIKHRKQVIDGNEKDNIPYDKIFHVAQGIVTPDASMIASPPLLGKYSTLLKLGKITTPHVIDWVTKDWKDLDLNVVIVDHYHTTNFVEEMLKLNITKLQKQ